MTAPGPASNHSLVGGWRLRSWISVAGDGSETAPWGERPSGLLTYTATGAMIVVMCRAGRPSFATDDLTGGSIVEQARAFGSFIAYGGSFEVAGDTVIHHVETSLFPNWVGTTQHRRWELDPSGRHLTLESPPLTQGGMARIQRLRWDRVGA